MSHKTIEIEVTYGITRNMGNYESLRLDYTVRQQITEEENGAVKTSMHNLRKALKKEIDIAVKEEVAQWR